MAIKFMHGDDERKHKRGTFLHNPPVLVIPNGFPKRLLVVTEAAMMQRCKHANICQLYDVSTQAVCGVPCVV